jgi:hypothetical protein
LSQLLRNALLRWCDKPIMGSDTPVPYIGHGTGTVNGSANNNKADISLFNWKPQKNEIHIHQGISGASVALIAGTGLAVGAALAWGTSRLAADDKNSNGQTEKQEGSIEEETYLSASAQLTLLRKRRQAKTTA